MSNYNKQAGAELGQAQPQLGLRLANVKTLNWDEKQLKRWKIVIMLEIYNGDEKL